MSYFSLLLLVHVVLSALFFGFLLWVISKLLPFRWIKQFFQLWIDFLVIGIFTAIVLITNPVQNAERIMVCLALMYFMMYYILGRNSIGRRLIWGRKKEHWHYAGRLGCTTLWLAFVAIVAIAGRGKYIHTNEFTPTMDSQLYIDKEGAIGYDSLDRGAMDFVLQDQNKDGVFETIMYDLNKDGKVDQIMIDNDQNGSINHTKVMTYDSQKKLLVIITLLYLSLLLFSFYKKSDLVHEDARYLEEKLQKKTIPKAKKTDKKKPAKKESKAKKSTTRKTATTKKTKTTKKTSKKPTTRRSRKTNSFDARNAVTTIQAPQHKKSGSGALSALLVTVLCTSILFQSIGGAIAQTPVGTEKMTAQYEQCASNPFVPENCEGVEEQAVSFFQHMTNPLFVNEFRSWKAIFDPCSINLVLCSREPYLGYKLQFEKWRSEWTKKTAIMPGIQAVIIDTPSLSGVSSGEIQEDLLSTGITLDQEPEKAKETVTYDTNLILSHYEDFSQLLIQQNGDASHLEDMMRVRNLDDFVNRITTDEEHISTINSEVLSEINRLGVTREFDRYEGLTHEKLDTIKSAIQKWQGTYGLYTDELYFALWDVWKTFEPFESQTLQQRVKAKNIDGKFSKTIDALNLRGKGGSFIDDYYIYLWNFGDEVFATNLTTASLAWKRNIGANPYDITMNLFAGVIDLLGFDYATHRLSSATFGYRSQLILFDAAEQSDMFSLVNEAHDKYKNGSSSFIKKTFAGIKIGFMSIYSTNAQIIQHIFFGTEGINTVINEVVEGLYSSYKSG